MQFDNLYKLNKEDVNRGAESIASAFSDYPMFKYILGEKLDSESIKVFLRFIIKYAVLYGEAYAISEKLEGIILFSDFRIYKFSLIRQLRCGVFSLMKYGKEVGDRFTKFDQFTLKMHNEAIKEPHQYIILLGVASERQGQGFGRKLMLPLLNLADQQGQACYLETHGGINVEIYQRYGFEVVSKGVVPGSDIMQYSMLRKEKT
ncbi:GNAT family N-acetyltransferase [Alkalicella caledoniensis]|uniref:GNAT family N-acetyltransferase n=1 Tax=Alkalicella caledoniensis TaxID=2731377 RepID=A0A7G9W5X5_ALKCA|nr:GNAT family N-acetyltransferase [Alkalicella caledoniensis]QNO14087.1 GNAT family N-acetyltransferase [Alkalicella caledoniensis]